MRGVPLRPTRPAVTDRDGGTFVLDPRGHRLAPSPRWRAARVAMRAVVFADVLFLATTAVSVLRGAEAFFSGVAAALVLGLVSMPWVLVDIGAWDMDAPSLRLRQVLSGVGLVVAGLILLGPERRRGGEGLAPRESLDAFALGVAVLSAAALVAATAARRATLPRGRPDADSRPDDAVGGPAALALGLDLAPPAREEPVASSAGTRGRGALLLRLLGGLWAAAGVVETFRGNWWLGMVVVAGGVITLATADSMLDRRGEHHVRRVDRRAATGPTIVVVGAVLLVARAVWLLATR